MTDEAIMLDTLKFIREQTTYIAEHFVNIRSTIWYNFSRSRQDFLENRLIENILMSFNRQNQNEVELTAQSRLYIEKEDKKLEIKFLKYLLKQPDIKLFMVNNFIKPDPKSPLTNYKSDNGANFLKELKGRGLIAYEDEDLSHISNDWYEEDPPVNKRWFDTLHRPMRVKVTKPGKNYLLSENEVQPIAPLAGGDTTRPGKKKTADTGSHTNVWKAISNNDYFKFIVIGLIVGLAVAYFVFIFKWNK